MKKSLMFFGFCLQKSTKEKPRGIGMFSTSATRTELVFLSIIVFVFSVNANFVAHLCILSILLVYVVSLFFVKAKSSILLIKTGH